MTARKEPVDIHCIQCKTDFRLWIPVEALPRWESGVKINCISCGTPHSVRKNATGFIVAMEQPVVRTEAPAPQPQVPVQAPQPPQPVQVQQPVEPQPVQAPAPEPPQPVQAHQPVPEHAAAAARAPVAAEVPAVQAAPAHTPVEAPANVDTVLLIEDDKLSRTLALNAVKDSGIRLITAQNSTEALGAVEKENVMLIVTDLYLKDPADPDASLDGEELLQKIRDKGITAPAIITTGKDIIDDLVLDPKWFDLKVKGFIQKGNPFWVEELSLKIKEVLYKE